MEADSTTLTRVGAWGQLLAAALGTAFWFLSVPVALYITCGGYVVVTMVGIVGIARRESVPGVGPLVYPFIVPGFLAIYHFSTQY